MKYVLNAKSKGVAKKRRLCGFCNAIQLNEHAFLNFVFDNHLVTRSD